MQSLLFKTSDCFLIIRLERAWPQHENNNIHRVKDKRSAEKLEQQIAQF